MQEVKRVFEVCMARRWIHYEAAFEEHVRSLRVPCVAIDETRRSLLGEQSLKSFDFLVRAPDGRLLLCDVKGRLCRTSGERSGSLQKWTHREDLEALDRWAGLFGGTASGFLVFAHWLTRDPDPHTDTCPTATAVGVGRALSARGAKRDRRCPVHIVWRGRAYRFMAVRIQDYLTRARNRSESWQTIDLSARDFDDLATPFVDLVHNAAPQTSTLHGIPSPQPLAV